MNRRKISKIVDVLFLGFSAYQLISGWSDSGNVYRALWLILLIWFAVRVLDFLFSGPISRWESKIEKEMEAKSKQVKKTKKPTKTKSSNKKGKK
ncbi:MAG: hypothetical protein AAF413_02040 [Patescibacteria group bacterium]